DALFEVFAQNSFDQEVEQPTAIESPSELDDFDESTMANLLADEPSAEAFDGKLDSDTIASAGMDFEEFNRAGVTILLATHDVGLVNTRPQYRHFELNQGFLSEVEDYGR
ncbi:cell division ATP-binding protein FtsE, partial [Vibrio parahaemolyticus AQ3810]